VPDAQIAGPTVDFEALRRIGRDLLLALGEDLSRPGLTDTPDRFARAWREFIEYKPGKISTAFDCEQLDQLVVVRDVRLWSMCEHHLLPFFADVTMGYLTKGKILGASKLVRIAQLWAHRLNVQENMAAGIARSLKMATGSADVAVLCRGVHLCMVMRGVSSDAEFTSSEMLGWFRDRPETRAEFLQLALAQRIQW
jgi:GTP cyclohydrolase I